MREYRLHIMSLLLALFTISCQSDMTPEFEVNKPTTSGIELCISGGTLGVTTRAEDMTDTAKESAVTHLDVMIFNDAATDEQKSIFYYERVTTASPEGNVHLGVDVSTIEVGKRYWVYVVANSTLDESVYSSNINNLKELFALTEQTYNLHLTATGMQNTPSHFLMDGVAYKGATEPSTADAITIAETEITDVVTLNVKLRRAAAKVVVKLITDGKITFANDIANATPGYYMRNTPYLTRVINDGVVRQLEHLETTNETMSAYYKWMSDDSNNITGVEITAYVYSHTWDTSDSFAYATNLLVDIPAYYTTEVEGVETKTPHPNNYYQVPLSKEFKFERNHYYEVTANVHAPGAEDFSEPVEITDLKYSVLPWTERTIDVGGEQGPEYLKVNLNELKMFNTPVDAESLLFASSSPVKIAIEDCYYIDKFGTKQSVDASDYNISGITANGSLSGNITVNSDVPTNNTIRYFRIKVTNQTGQVEYIDVEHYPLIYIVNILGYYSYRDDFKQTDAKPTTYTYKGDCIVSLSLGSFNSTTQTWTYNYLTTPPSGGGWYGSSGGFWSSKVVTEDYSPTHKDASYRGRARIQYYTWDRNGNSPSHGNNTDNPGNARMYHIRVTSTSGTYNIGKPRMVTNDYVSYEYTDEGTDNANLVSPSFMTASRLSKVDIQNYGNNLNTEQKQYAMSRDHCANYVEVDRNGNVYDNWRLPTAAELKIIMDLQGTANVSADAIDYLLDADFYMSASGLIYNRKNSDNSSEQSSSRSQWAIRCIRDAY